jgi:hypothetical protein
VYKIQQKVKQEFYILPSAQFRLNPEFAVAIYCGLQILAATLAS